MKKTLNKIVMYIVHLMQPEKIILFGSVAKGKNNVYSDIDLLAISEISSDKNTLAKQIKSFANEFSLSVDIIICSQQELNHALSEKCSFLGAIAKSGKVVYERDD